MSENRGPAIQTPNDTAATYQPPPPCSMTRKHAGSYSVCASPNRCVELNINVSTIIMIVVRLINNAPVAKVDCVGNNRKISADIRVYTGN